MQLVRTKAPVPICFLIINWNKKSLHKAYYYLTPQLRLVYLYWMPSFQNLCACEMKFQVYTKKGQYLNNNFNFLAKCRFCFQHFDFLETENKLIDLDRLDENWANELTYFQNSQNHIEMNRIVYVSCQSL